MKKSICFFCTAPITFQCFLKEHAIGLLNTYNVTLISNFENYTFLIDERNNNQIDSKQLDKIKKILLFYDYDKLSLIYESQINAKK